jgi:DNA-directed RNA polymerase alpha subunit
MRLVKLTNEYRNLNAGEVGGYSEKEAADVVCRGWGIYDDVDTQDSGALDVIPDEDPDDLRTALGSADIDEEVIKVLGDAGITTIDALRVATSEELVALPRIGEKTAIKLREAVA